MKDLYTILPAFSLQPNKIVTYNRVFHASKFEETYEKALERSQKTEKRPLELSGHNKVKRKFHNFEISTNAYRNLKSKINWLYHLAKSKSVKTYSGKQIFNFKIAFITLTLPSKQIHPTHEITQKCFNQFITEIRQRTKMVNFVWRLEFQHSGNVHYHLVTDTYLDYHLALSVWNRIINKLGYVDSYQKRFKNLSLREYNNTVNSSGKTDFSVIAKRYAKGCSKKWSNPNSVDVRSVVSGKQIANYVSKYFGKDAKSKSKCNELDNEENSFALRLWFCSRSLSKLKSVSNFQEAVDYNLFRTFSELKIGRKVITKYANIIYFDFKSLPIFVRQFVEKLLTTYRKSVNYNPV